MKIKKLLCITVLTISSLMSFAQSYSLTPAYLRSSSIRYGQFDGSRTSYTNIAVALSIDTSLCIFDDVSHLVWVNGVGVFNTYCLWRDSVNGALEIMPPDKFFYIYGNKQQFQLAATTHTVNRPLNTTYTIAGTAYVETYVDYDIDIQTTVNLIAGTQASTLFLEYSTDGGNTWILEDRGRNTQSITVSISVGLVTINTIKITGWIPKQVGVIPIQVRLRPNGTGTITYFFGRERY